MLLEKGDMRLCRIAALVRTASVRKQFLDGVTGPCGSRSSLSSMNGVDLRQSIPSLIFQRFFAEAVTAAAHEDDAPRPGHSQKTSPEQASSTCSDTPERWSAQAGSKQHKPVLLSEAIKALDFDWENVDSEESGDRADSGKSASTSETGGSGGGSRKKNSFRAPSEGCSSTNAFSFYPQAVKAK